MLAFRFRIVTTIVLFLFLASCAANDGLQVDVSNDIRLKTKYSSHTPAAGQIAHVYKIERPIAVTESYTAFVIGFPSNFSSAVLELLHDGSVVYRHELSGETSGKPVVFSLPLEPATRFDTIQLLDPSVESPLVPLSAGMAPVLSGVVFDPEVLIDVRVGFSVQSGNPHTEYSFDISKLVDSMGGMVQVRLRYRYDKEGVGSASVTARSGNNEVSFELRPRIGGATVYLYEGTCGFIPDAIEVKISDSNLEVVSLTVEDIAEDSARGFQEPLPIDLGAVIHYNSALWRRDDYELFSWNLYPRIVVIDTASYAIQSEFFKRLAFFVEKAESAGSLVTDGFLDGRHGWNAHDYQAIDLARFYNQAEVEGFPLNPRELHLRDILVDNGIIKTEDDTYVAVEGGIITLSQESTPRLRYLFMVHEGYHGIFFSDSDYRGVAFDIWDGLSDLEREFWREFLLLRNYNINDGYLVVNELQAYLMQVSADRLDAYYWDYTVPNLAEVVPRTKTLVADLLSEHPDTFHRAALRLEKALRLTAGIGAEDVFCLRRVE